MKKGRAARIVQNLKRISLWCVIVVAATAATYFTGEAFIPQRHVIIADLGGSVYGFTHDYTIGRLRGDTYRVEGVCVSACTEILGLVPSNKVCASPYSRWGFHAAFYHEMGMRVFSKEGTEFVWSLYPPAVQDLLRKKGWSGPDVDHPDLIWLDGTELALVGAVQPCK